MILPRVIISALAVVDLLHAEGWKHTKNVRDKGVRDLKIPAPSVTHVYRRPLTWVRELRTFASYHVMHLPGTLWRVRIGRTRTSFYRVIRKDTVDYHGFLTRDIEAIAAHIGVLQHDEISSRTHRNGPVSGFARGEDLPAQA